MNSGSEKQTFSVSTPAHYSVVIKCDFEKHPEKQNNFTCHRQQQQQRPQILPARMRTEKANRVGCAVLPQNCTEHTVYGQQTDLLYFPTFTGQKVQMLPNVRKRPPRRFRWVCEKKKTIHGALPRVVQVISVKSKKRHALKPHISTFIWNVPFVLCAVVLRLEIFACCPHSRRRRLAFDFTEELKREKCTVFGRFFKCLFPGASALEMTWAVLRSLLQKHVASNVEKTNQHAWGFA